MCLAYPLALGGTLHDRLEASPPRRVESLAPLTCGALAPLPWQTRCRILSETLQALTYLHGYDGPHVLHLDVKPSNILIDEHCHVLLAATGTATRRSTHPSEEQAYIDPLMRESRPHTMHDGYAFGVVTLATLVGCLEGMTLSVLCHHLRVNQNECNWVVAPDAKAGEWPAALSARLVRVASLLIAKEVCSL